MNNEKKQQDVTIDNLDLKQLKKENPTGFAVVIREFKKDKVALISLFILIAFLLFIFIEAAIIDIEKLKIVDVFRKYEAPSFNNFWNFLGRDSGGRSVMGYLIVGTRNSVIVGVSITILTTIFGLLTGLLMGYYGGKFDSAMMRIIDFIGTLPTMMIIIAFVSVVPRYGILSLILLMSAFYWIGTARLVRSKALSEGRRDYVNASKTMGTNDLKIMFGGILPNISSIIIVDSTLSMAGNIGIEVALSFLGFGLPAATPSLGTLIAYASKPEIIQHKMYVWLPAALVLLGMMLSINYIGQALRRASDAKQRRG